MSLLQQAKAFLASSGTKIALAVIPLAALTTIVAPANASTISTVHFNPNSCGTSGGLFTCGISQVAPNGGNTNANWVGVYSNGGLTGPGIGIVASGTASGLFSGTQIIPVSWDFFINIPNGGTPVNWTLTFGITDTGLVDHTYTTTGTVTPVGNTEITGQGAITIVSATASNFFIDLFATSPIPFTLNVPGGATLDLNPSTRATATPEPASLLLAGAGIAGLLWRKRKQA